MDKVLHLFGLKRKCIGGLCAANEAGNLDFSWKAVFNYLLSL